MHKPHKYNVKGKEPESKSTYYVIPVCKVEKANNIHLWCWKLGWWLPLSDCKGALPELQWCSDSSAGASFVGLLILWNVIEWYAYDGTLANTCCSDCELIPGQGTAKSRWECLRFWLLANTYFCPLNSPRGHESCSCFVYRPSGAISIYKKNRGIVKESFPDHSLTLSHGPGGQSQKGVEARCSTAVGAEHVCEVGLPLTGHWVSDCGTADITE